MELRTKAKLQGDTGTGVQGELFWRFILASSMLLRELSIYLHVSKERVGRQLPASLPPRDPGAGQ